MEGGVFSRYVYLRWVHQSDTRFILRNVLWEWISCIKHPYPSWPRSCTYNPKWKKIKSWICINHVKEVTFWSGSDKIFSKKYFFLHVFFCILREYKILKKRAHGEQNKNTNRIALRLEVMYFKGGTFFFPGFRANVNICADWSTLASFKDFLIIFCAKESWDHARKNSKVFYPPH